MEFFRLKCPKDNKIEDVIVRLAKMPCIDKNYPNKLNPNNPCEISLNIRGEFYRFPFNNKADADNYFNYVMEKLRAVELKHKPW
ncbi:MAG: hypothetical protein ACMZI0_10315 [Symbiopectobacterium sp.]|uniref:hypothetical protein n=1 Tax=Symbiopectobacterium sp. TaxID=2952789 RepID=UPI0039E92D43